VSTRRKVLLGGAGLLALGAGGLAGRRAWLDREPSPARRDRCARETAVEQLGRHRKRLARRARRPGR
jgi:hypothetical protein